MVCVGDGSSFVQKYAGAGAGGGRGASSEHEPVLYTETFFLLVTRVEAD